MTHTSPESHACVWQKVNELQIYDPFKQKDPAQVAFSIYQSIFEWSKAEEIDMRSFPGHDVVLAILEEVGS